MPPATLLLFLIATASAALAHLLWGRRLIQLPIFWMAALAGCLIAYAQTLGYDNAAGLLKQTLSEEEAADEKLTQLGEGGINQAAAAVGAGSGEEEDE